MENESLAIESLEKVARMAEEMEENYKEKIEILNIQVEDTCRILERYILENEKMAEKIQDLNNGLEKHTEWNKISMALYVLLFVYGLVYGKYFGTHQPEL